MYGLLLDHSSANGHTFEMGLIVLKVLCLEKIVPRRVTGCKSCVGLRIHLSNIVMGVPAARVEARTCHQVSESIIISPDDAFLKRFFF